MVALIRGQVISVTGSELGICSFFTAVWVMVMYILVNSQWPGASRLFSSAQQALHDPAVLSTPALLPTPFLPGFMLQSCMRFDLICLTPPIYSEVSPFPVPAPHCSILQLEMLFFSSLTSWGELLLNLRSGITSREKWGHSLFWALTVCTSGVHLQHQSIHLFKCLPSHDRVGALCILSPEYIKIMANKCLLNKMNVLHR